MLARRLILALLLLLAAAAPAAAAWTEFYCDPVNGSNLNAGSTTAAAATYTSTNGNWDGSAVFTPTDGSTPASTVSANMFASIYLDAATTTPYVARITTVAAGVNGAITLSTTAKSGTAPTSGTTGRSIKVGGCWKGPNGADSFPLAFIAGTLSNAAGNTPSVNMLAGTYSVSASIARSAAGPVLISGCSSLATPRDGTQATIDAGGLAASLWTNSGNFLHLANLYLTNCTGATSDGFNTSGTYGTLRNVTIKTVGRDAFSLAGGYTCACECEAADVGNAAIGYGFNCTNGNVSLDRCLVHDDALSANQRGFILGAASSATHCAAFNLGSYGFRVNGGAVALVGCDAYNTATYGYFFNQSAGYGVYLCNCNAVKTGTAYYGGVANTIAWLQNCGAYATSARSANIDTSLDQSPINYAANTGPWRDPGNGDFTVTVGAALRAGRGTFNVAGYTSPPVFDSYPTVGAQERRVSPSRRPQ